LDPFCAKIKSMSYDIKIALAGNFYSGKTSIARTLGACGWTVLDVTQNLKLILVNMLQSQGFHIDLNEIVQNKDKYRSLLQELGIVIDWDLGLGVQMALDKWRKAGAKTPAVLDAVRTVGQWKLLEKEGFILVRLNIGEETLIKRAAKFGVTKDRLEEIQRYLNKNLLPPQAGEYFINTEKDLKKIIIELSHLGGFNVE